MARVHRDVELFHQVTSASQVPVDQRIRKILFVDSSGTPASLTNSALTDTANSTTLTLTSNGSDQTVTGSVGTLSFDCPDNIYQFGLGADTNETITVNANSGDATLRLQVNNTSANAWDILNDNSASDQLRYNYNGSNKAVLETDGTFQAVGIAATGDVGGTGGNTTLSNVSNSDVTSTTATLGGIGASGPSTSTQNGWLKVYTGTDTRWVPIWA